MPSYSIPFFPHKRKRYSYSNSVYIVLKLRKERGALMSEKSKMEKQSPYHPNALSLVAWRNQTERRLYRFNHRRVSGFDRRNVILKNMLHAKGLFTIQPPFYCSYGSHIYIGRDFSCGRNAIFHDAADIRIGDHVQIGNDVKLITSLPVKDPVLRKKHIECAAPIIIDDNVYIGNQVVILSGVTIGSGSIVMDGSIVSENVDAGVVVGGNPCVVKECESEWCKPFHEAQSIEGEDDTCKERLLERVNLEYIEKTIHAVSFACGVYLGFKALQQVIQKQDEIKKQRKRIEGYLPIVEKACDCSCRLKHK